MMKIIIGLTLWLPIEASAGKVERMINYSELQPGRIVGSLGKPLGTIVQVSGTLIDGDSLRMKALTGKVLLKVTTVDKKKLSAPVTIEFSSFSDSGAKEPKAGTQVTYLGYELVRMTGIPHAAFKYIPARTTTDLYFKMHFMVCKQVL